MNKIPGFIVNLAMCGLFAVFIAIIPHIMLMIVCNLLMIPIEIMTEGMLKIPLDNWSYKYGYQIVYPLTLITMMLDEYDIPNPWGSLKNWWYKRKAASAT